MEEGSYNSLIVSLRSRTLTEEKDSSVINLKESTVTKIGMLTKRKLDDSENSLSAYSSDDSDAAGR